MIMNGKKIKLQDDTFFDQICYTLDNKMKQLSWMGCMKPHNKARIIMIEEELLWRSGILGSMAPKQLVETLLYMFGVHCALWAGVEHRALCAGENSQLKVKTDPECGLRYLEYSEDSSKNNPGGIDHRKFDKKVVRAYENKVMPKCCIVKLYTQYMASCPTDPKCSGDFYLRPLAVPHGDVWYSCQPIGHQKLATIVADMAKCLDLKGKVTNHSLWATTASHLFHQNIDEQMFMERTGHHSTSVCSYKHTSSDQLHEVSSILYGNCSQGLWENVSNGASAQCDDHDQSKKHCAKIVNPVVSNQNESKGDINCNQQNTVSPSSGETKSVSFNFTVNINK